jgi:hypothetical protein
VRFIYLLFYLLQTHTGGSRVQLYAFIDEIIARRLPQATTTNWWQDTKVCVPLTDGKMQVNCDAMSVCVADEKSGKTIPFSCNMLVYVVE